MNVHLDASYLSEAGTRSRACRHFFMGWNTKDGNPIKLNGAFSTLCAVLCFVVTSATEAKLGEGMIYISNDTRRVRPPSTKTQIHCDIATAAGIANNIVKRQHLQYMEMRYCWVCDKLAQDAYNVKWHPGQENLADYQS
jgi:hypothetical protein